MRPRRSLDEATATRDLFVLALGSAGILLGAGFALAVPGRDAAAVLALAAWVSPATAAVTALLAADALRCVARPRRWSALLWRLGLLGLNAILLVAELLVLVVSALAGAPPTP